MVMKTGELPGQAGADRAGPDTHPGPDAPGQAAGRAACVYPGFDVADIAGHVRSLKGQP